MILVHILRKLPLTLLLCCLIATPIVEAKPNKSNKPAKSKSIKHTKAAKKPAYVRTSTNPSTSSYQQNSKADDLIIAARNASKNNQTDVLSRILPQIGNHALTPYVEFWWLKSQKLMDKESAKQFLQQYNKTAVADRLRNEWLKQMANVGDYSEFANEYPLLQNPDNETKCHILTFRLNNRDGNALAEAENLWLKQTAFSKACQPIIDVLVWNNKISLTEVWARARRQVEDKQLSTVATTLRYLPASQSVAESKINVALRNPELYLRSMLGSDRSSRELAALSLAIIARSNFTRAADLLENYYAGKLGDEAEAWVWGLIGWFAALERHEQSSTWLQKSWLANMSAEPAEWRTRAFLFANNWAAVEKSILAMPKELQNEAAWIYWLGRALKNRGSNSEAKILFEKLTRELGFYSALADEELGRLPGIVGRGKSVSAQDIEKIAAQPEVIRAFALANLGMRPEANFEWAWVSKNYNDNELLAAATLAAQNNLYDLSISAAAKTKTEHDLNLRFPQPHYTVARDIIKDRQLDDAWVYGLMRQESRFIISARSNVGATGLMQLMPATAQFVANKIGMVPFGRWMMEDIPSNIKIGTAYMRMVLGGLDNSMVLATAAYNAGPGRANRWRANRSIEGAIYAENIPFTETRNYVKFVMANSVYYNAVFRGRSDSLLARLGNITPVGENSTRAAASLP